MGERQRVVESNADRLVKCQIHVWTANSKWKKGHVSLTIGSEYVSWWPERKGPKDIRIEYDAKINTLEDDINEYGVGPKTYEIEASRKNVLNCKKLWKRTKRSLSDCKYNAVRMNCCTVVVQVLHELNPNFIKDKPFVWAPFIVQWAIENSDKATHTDEQARARPSWLIYLAKYSVVQFFCGMVYAGYSMWYSAASLWNSMFSRRNATTTPYLIQTLPQ